MADIQLDNLTNTSGTGVFDQLMGAVNTQIEQQYLNNRLTGSEYAQVYLGGMQAVLQQSMQFVLQEQLTEAQIDGIAADNLLKAKQLEIAEQELLIKQQDLLLRAEELALKVTEANRLRDTTEAELEKQWGYGVTRDGNGDLILGEPTDLGKIDKDIEKMQADIDIATEQLEIAKSNVALEKAKAIASIDKEYGYNYTIDVDGNIVVGENAGDGKLDAEVAKVQVETQLAEQRIVGKKQSTVISG